MRCLLIRTEVFGKTELSSYGCAKLEDEETALSVFKAELINKINHERMFPTRDNYDNLGFQQEDRYYVYDLQHYKGDTDKLGNDFFKVVFKGQSRTNVVHSIPKGWEEILPENYNIQEVAFRIKNEA